MPFRRSALTCLCLGAVVDGAAWWPRPPPPRLRLPTGESVSLHGVGPPVMFSSGLQGLMPRRIYTELFRKLEANLTLLVLDDVAPCTRSVLEATADAIGAEQVGFLAHSSIDGTVLDSPRLAGAVLCDPVVTPQLSLTEGGLRPPRSIGEAPLLIVRAAGAYESQWGIPEFISPDAAPSRACSVETYPGVGHADLLDDPWAELGRTLFPWMGGGRGSSEAGASARPFLDWSPRDAPAPSVETRAAYRQAVATSAVHHFLHRTGLPAATAD